MQISATDRELRAQSLAKILMSSDLFEYKILVVAGSQWTSICWGTKHTANVYTECYWSGLIDLLAEQNEICGPSGEGYFRLCPPRGIGNLSHYLGTICPFYWMMREKLKCWRRFYILYLRFSLKDLFMWENCAKEGSIWIYIIIISVEWISVCQHPETFLGLNPNPC